MNRFIFTLAVAVGGLAGGTLAPSLKAGAWDKKTLLTVSQPIAVQGTVLAPGAYVFKLLNTPSDRDIVTIYNASETRLIASVAGTSITRAGSAGVSPFTFYEKSAGQAIALQNWYFPGQTSGLEFTNSYPAPASPASR